MTRVSKTTVPTDKPVCFTKSHRGCGGRRWWVVTFVGVFFLISKKIGTISVFAFFSVFSDYAVFQFLDALTH